MKPPHPNNTSINTNSCSQRQTISSKYGWLSNSGGGKKHTHTQVHKHPLGNFLWSSAKRLTSWTCANEQEIIMKGACKCRWGMWARTVALLPQIRWNTRVMQRNQLFYCSSACQTPNILTTSNNDWRNCTILINDKNMTITMCVTQSSFYTYHLVNATQWAKCSFFR